jgi:elongator complex protein 3
VVDGKVFLKYEIATVAKISIHIGIMEHIDLLVKQLLDLPAAARTPEQIILSKRSFCKTYKHADMPTNVSILKTYKHLVAQGAIEKAGRLEQLLKKRSVRSESGIVPIQVLTKPFRCPGKCIFCPNDVTMPKSYINTQPGAMRALLNNFDPYKQTYNRLLSLMLTWHATDKIEMIVLWGTRDVYPKKYKIAFIKWLYDACNHFDEFLTQIQIDYSTPKAPRYTVTEGLTIDYPMGIEESIKRNETASHRIIWLTVETRPEYVTDENCQFWREMWITRMEMGIQTLHNSVHDLNKRGHDNDAIVQAMHKLRQYGFKISNHYMPWLYGSTPEMDLETFRIAFEAVAIKSDELKFYPTAVIPNTELFDLRKSGVYTPIGEDDLAKIIRTVKLEIIPPYARIKRLARDFDTNEVVAWANTPNLRQLTMHAMEKEFATDAEKRAKQYARLYPEAIHIQTLDEVTDALSRFSSATTTSTNCEWRAYQKNDHVMTFVLWWTVDTISVRAYVCLCTRCREMRHIIEKPWTEHPHDLPFLVIRAYHSSNGIELFCAFEDKLGYLYWFTRLLLPSPWTTIQYPWLWEKTAMIRELHVYGTLQSLNKQKNKDHASVAQHGWFGTRLLACAEHIARVQELRKLRKNSRKESKSSSFSTLRTVQHGGVSSRNLIVKSLSIRLSLMYAMP